MKSVLSIGCGRGTPEEGGIDPGVDVDEGRQRMEASVRSGCSRGCFRSFWGRERGTPEEGGIGPGCCGGGVITTWAAGDGVIAAGSAV